MIRAVVTRVAGIPARLPQAKNFPDAHIHRSQKAQDPRAVSPPAVYRGGNERNEVDVEAEADGDRNENYRFPLQVREQSLQTYHVSREQVELTALRAYESYCRSVLHFANAGPPAAQRSTAIPSRLLNLIKRYPYSFGDKACYYPSWGEKEAFQVEVWNTRESTRDVEKYIFYCSPCRLTEPSLGTQYRALLIINYALWLLRLCERSLRSLNAEVARQAGRALFFPALEPQEPKPCDLVGEHEAAAARACPAGAETAGLRRRLTKALVRQCRLVEFFEKRGLEVKDRASERRAVVIFYLLFSTLYFHLLYVVNSLRTRLCFWLPGRDRSPPLSELLLAYARLTEEAAFHFYRVPTLDDWQEQESHTRRRLEEQLHSVALTAVTKEPPSPPLPVPRPQNDKPADILNGFRRSCSLKRDVSYKKHQERARLSYNEDVPAELRQAAEELIALESGKGFLRPTTASLSRAGSLTRQSRCRSRGCNSNSDTDRDNSLSRIEKGSRSRKNSGGTQPWVKNF